MQKKPRLLVTRLLPPEVEARIARDYDAIVNPEDRIWTADGMIERAAGCDAILLTTTEAMDAEVIARLPDSVRMIATFSVGVDHIDLKAAAARGVAVSNTPDVLTDATADVAVLCLLGAARLAQSAEATLREGRWTRWAPTEFLGVHVTGKRLGVLGMGRIGQGVAARMRGFGMAIHYHNRRRLPPEQEQGAVFHEDPEALLPVADFLSINCPLSEATRGFLDAGRIGLLPPGAVVVNTARGPIVDDEALISALRSGRVAAAGLDVFAGEPAFNRGYLDLPNAFLLPHIGSATVETRNAMGFTCLDNLDAHFAGRPLPNAVAP